LVIRSGERGPRGRGGGAGDHLVTTHAQALRNTVDGIANQLGQHVVALVSVLGQEVLAVEDLELAVGSRVGPQHGSGVAKGVLPY